jgi:hypothetical protein
MSDTVRDAIAEALAEVERVADAPVEPFGYGSDLVCTSDLTEEMAEHDGFDPQGLAEALLHRIDCPRGELPDDPNYGMDLRSYINRGVSNAELFALAGEIRNEWTKDDRVESAVVELEVSEGGKRISGRGLVTPVDPSVGGFALTFAATDAAVLLEEINAQ